MEDVAAAWRVVERVAVPEQKPVRELVDDRLQQQQQPRRRQRLRPLRPEPGIRSRDAMCPSRRQSVEGRVPVELEQVAELVAIRLIPSEQ